MAADRGWVTVSRHQPCGICGKPDWCRRTSDSDIQDCYRECGAGGAQKSDKSGQVFWRHSTKTFDPKKREEVEREEHPGIAYQRERADADTLNAVYSDLVAMLGLYDDHAVSFAGKRGLTVEEVRILGYRSFPSSRDAEPIVEKLVAKYGDQLLNVPGFDRVERSGLLADGKLLTRTELRLSGSSGVLLPQRDTEGRIVGMMLRLDDRPEADPTKKVTRYLPLTSYTSTGCAAQIGVHVPLCPSVTSRSIVRVIEGIIKADIVTLRTGVLTLGIPSGGRWLQGTRTAERLGAGGILLAPDADTRSNAGICATLTRAADDLAAKGSLFSIEVWPPEAGKGLDDVLHAGKSAEVVFNCGIDIWTTLKTWLASSKAPRDAHVEARIILDGVVAKAQRDPASAFRPNIAEYLALLDPASVETQRILSALKEVLRRSGWSDFERRMKEARRKRETVLREQKLNEVQASGRHIFKLGDQAEARNFLLDDLTPVGSVGVAHDLCVFDRGALHKYADGIYAKLEESALITQVADYSGSPLGAFGVLKVSKGFAQGTVELVYDKTSKKGFFDEAPAGVAFKDGFLLVDRDTKTLKFVPHSREHRARVRYDFDRQAGGAPVRFLAALGRYFRNDSDMAEKIACVQEYMGSCIMGEAPRFQKAVIFRGRGNDGKSAVAKILIKIMPPNSVASIAPQKFGDDYSRASLDGKLLNVVFEMPEGDIMDSSATKAIIVADPIEARNPYERPFWLVSRAGQLWICNSLPRTRDTDPAFRRRFILIEFNEPLGAEEVNENFVAEILAAETPQIVAWAIEGFRRRLQAKDYTIPASSTEAINEWLRDCDPLAQFVDERLLILTERDRADPKNWTKATPLYSDYRAWARDRGHTLPCLFTTFGNKLTSKLGLSKLEKKRGDGSYYPVRLKPSDAKMQADGEKISPEDLDVPACPQAAANVEPAAPHLRLVHPSDRYNDPEAERGRRIAEEGD